MAIFGGKPHAVSTRSSTKQAIWAEYLVGVQTAERWNAQGCGVPGKTGRQSIVVATTSRRSDTTIVSVSKVVSVSATGDNREHRTAAGNDSGGGSVFTTKMACHPRIAVTYRWMARSPFGSKK